MGDNSLRDELQGQIIDYLTNHIEASEVKLDRLYKMSCDLADIALDMTVETFERDMEYCGGE